MPPLMLLLLLVWLRQNYTVADACGAVDAIAGATVWSLVDAVAAAAVTAAYSSNNN